MKRAAFLALCLACAALFAGLGVWQVERLQWKTSLVASVETRLAAPAQEPPAWNQWSLDLAYTKVRLSGEFLHDRETLVLAVTEQGAGFWVMTPLRTERGLVLINRGFVPAERDPLSNAFWTRPEGAVSVTGLLRASEPNGAFLRANAPEQDRWYSRDVQAIAGARQLNAPVAPYFIDADASSASDYPIGGLTVVHFRNSHLVYALTWFALAAMCLAAAAVVGLNRIPFRTPRSP